MAAEDFIIELGCAELPPKALRPLSNAFRQGIAAGLEKTGLGHGDIKAFATPRRLAVRVEKLQTRQQDTELEKFGPAVQAAFDNDGKAKPAALGFARSCGVEVEALERAEKDGVEKLVYRAFRKGLDTRELLPDIVSQALARLPIPRKMRWGSTRDEFVRPVYWVLMLLGADVVKARFFGIDTGKVTYGHRFHHPDPITINAPGEYEKALLHASVITDYDERKSTIRQQVEAEGHALDAQAVIEDDLLEEVTSLVEWPVALTGRFDNHFLRVPAEALVSSLKNHQKCFYVVDRKGNMLPHFIAVSNITSRDPAQVVSGNERVIRPRLADAAFFYETDCKTPLAERVPALKKIVFQQQLGTVYEKCERVSALAGFIAGQTGANKAWCERAAMLAKADLVSEMVLEFAELQGIMGYHYAHHDKEADEVAAALNEQYMPRFSGDQLPETPTGAVLAIAEKLDTITGLFAIGQPPTGSKDPFALRRAALGALRIIVEKELPLDLRECINFATKSYQSIVKDMPWDTAAQVFDFMLERFRAWYRDEGVSAEVFQSVFELKPSRPLDFARRIRAVHHFASLPESDALAAANKRVANILQQLPEQTLPAIDQELLSEPAELELASEIERLTNEVHPLFDKADYTSGLEKLADCKSTVDRFFDEVLVMDENAAVRLNRLALVNALRQLFLEVADISCLHRARD